MHAYLAEHRALAPARIKETHFFDDELLDWSAPDYAAFHAFFSAVPESAQAFDATPIYTFWPPALGRIRRYNAAARLIVLLRDPIERAYSHWAMEHRRGWETMPFGEAIREGRARLSAASPLLRAWRVFSYVERGFYAGQVRRALSLFPRHQLLFIDAADLRRTHAGVLQKVATFLDLPAFPTVFPKLEHAGPLATGPSAQDVDYLRSIFASDVEEMASLTGLDPGGWLTMRRD